MSASDWQFSVNFAIRRCARDDKGAKAGRAGIAGLPNPETGETAERCYRAAVTARQAYQAARRKRGKPELEPGTTGNKEWDKQLGLTVDKGQPVAV